MYLKACNTYAAALSAGEHVPGPECPREDDDDETKTITITMTLNQDYSELVLRLVRAGVETTEITVDGQQTHLVTADRLGSDEIYVVSTFDLKLGPLRKGAHTIELTAADDRGRNGCPGWDALALYGRQSAEGGQ
jgi:hypothetical protein